jgi:hypothetical protein
MLPVVNAGQVELLDLHDLRQELIGLERRRGLSGRDRVVHPPSREGRQTRAAKRQRAKARDRPRFKGHPKRLDHLGLARDLR